MRKTTRLAAASAVVLGLASLAAWADADLTVGTGSGAVDRSSGGESDGGFTGVSSFEGDAVVAAAPAVYVTGDDAIAIDMSHTGSISAMQVTNGFNNLGHSAVPVAAQAYFPPVDSGALE